MKTTSSLLRKVLLLDGGTGEELCARKAIANRSLWSASVFTQPNGLDVLKQVHLDFLHAGCSNLTTNTYSITPGVNFSNEEIVRYTSQAGSLARFVVDEFNATNNTKVQLGGSLPPLSESYRPDLVLPPIVALPVYKLMMFSLQRYVDYWHAETMSSSMETKMVISALAEFSKNGGLPLWVSFTLNSKGQVRSGESVSDACNDILTFAQEHGVNVEAILFNCCEPEAVDLALESLPVPLNPHVVWGAYPNFLTPVPPGWTMKDATEYQPLRTDLSVEKFVSSFVRPWLKRGLGVVGGCCGATPAHIRAIRTELNAMQE